MISSSDLNRALDHLRGGGVVAIPTETYFTLCADARRPSAVESVLRLKSRTEQKAVAVLVPDVETWGSLVVDIPPLAKRMAQRFWPGPLTIALEAKEGLHPALRFRGRVSVRIPGPSPALELIRAFAGPLTGTSANPSGAPSPLTEDDVRSYFSGRAELLVLPLAATGGMASTVIDIDGSEGNGWRMVRPGAIPASVLDEVGAAEAAE